MKRLIGAIIVVGLSVITARYAYLKAGDMSWFELLEVEITCPENLDSTMVLKKSNLEIGESIFEQDFVAAADSLLTIPGVEAIKVKRKLPSKVELQLQPDKVVLFVKTNKIHGLTRGLKMIDVDVQNEVLPVVTGISLRKKNYYENKIKLCYALSIYDELCLLSKNLSSRLSEIHFKNNELVELYFDPGGAKVMLTLRNFEQTLSRLVVIDSRGLLGSSGSFNMTAGKMVVKGGV